MRNNPDLGRTRGAAQDGSPPPPPPPPGAVGWPALPVHIGSPDLAAHLALEPLARGIVAVAHADGSCLGARRRDLPDTLHQYGLGTLVFDPLTAPERQDPERLVDVELQAQRLQGALRWLRADERTAALGAGLWGSHGCAAAALVAAAQHPGRVCAVVCCAGRPGLAGHWLERVTAPTLLIVAGHDVEALRLGELASRRLRCAWRLEVVPGATASFEEPGAIETVAHLAGSWLAHHLRTSAH